MKYKTLFAFFAVTVCGFGCATAKTEPKAPEMVSFTAETEAAALDVATKFANGFYTALKEGDFSAWQQVMPADFSRSVTAQKFNAMRSDIVRIYGAPAEFTYLNVIRNGKVRDYLWRITLTVPEKVVPPAKTKNESCDIVWGVRVYCEKGKPPQIGGYRFYPFGMPDRNRK